MKERWAEIKELFGAVFELAPEERARALDRPDVDPWLRDQVVRLLAASDSDAGLLDEPAIAQLDPLVTMARGPELLSRSVGPYRVVREIGRGGMGIVYEAVRDDQEFEQRVAIKTLRIGLGLPDLVNQFRQERQILAALQHPNIAALLDGGVTDDGVPYIVLEYVDGVPIDRYCEANQLGLHDRLDLFRQVLDAVQYAHRQLVIHRDLKPSNILVTKDGHVKLLDFGIARLIRADGREVTQPGSGAITPAYASPEQLRGERASTSTDVYSLALVLYRLLAGKSPLTEELISPAALLAALSTDPLPPPSADPSVEAATTMGLGSVARLRRLLAGELDAVILKALRLEPDRRYGSVEALGDDILRYLKGLPVTAKPDTAWYRVSKFVRRRRGAVLGAAVAVIALIVGAGAALWQANRAEIQARRATKVATFLQQMIGASVPLAGLHAPRLGPTASVAALVDSAASRIDSTTAGDPEINVVLHHLFGLVYQYQERPEEAAAQYAAMARLARPTFGPGLAEATVLAALGAASVGRQDWQAADSFFRQTSHILAGLDRRRPDRYGAMLRQFGVGASLPWPVAIAGVETQVRIAQSYLLLNQGKVAEAVAMARTALAAAQAVETPTEDRARAMTTLGLMLVSTSADKTEGSRLLWGALRHVDSLPDPDVGTKADVLWGLVSTGVANGAQADSLGREMFRIYEQATGPQSLTMARQLWLRGATARTRGDTTTQRKSLERAVEIVRTHPAATADLRQTVVMEYARTQWLAGRMDSAVSLARSVYRERSTATPGLSVVEAGQLLGTLLHIRGQRNPAARGADYQAAEPVLLQADSIARASLPAANYWPQTTAGSLVRLYQDWGKPALARRYLALLPDSARRKFVAVVH